MSHASYCSFARRSRGAQKYRAVRGEPSRGYRQQQSYTAGVQQETFGAPLCLPRSKSVAVPGTDPTMIAENNRSPLQHTGRVGCGILVFSWKLSVQKHPEVITVCDVRRELITDADQFHSIPINLSLPALWSALLTTPPPTDPHNPPGGFGISRHGPPP